MKKIVRQQNYLKELIETQGNRLLSRQALKCLVRSTLEPLLDNPEAGVVLFRIEDKNGLSGLLKRLEFSEVESFSFADNSENIAEKVWANTEFLCVMTHRYVFVIIWENNTGDNNFVKYYSLCNSKLQNEPLDIIKRNSKIDISIYQEKYNPDRRDNLLLNAAFRKLLENMDEAANDAVLGYAEKSAETLKEADFTAKKAKVISHEIKNQLSICELYTEIIKKYTEKKAVDRKNINKALRIMNKSLKMASNSLISLKSGTAAKLKPVNLNEIVNEAAELADVYLKKNTELQITCADNITVSADFEKLIAIIINLIKNASEAFGAEENVSKKGKYIRIETDREDNFGVIRISNNAPGIAEPEKIFNEGFTTKSSGSGLGLWICKKYAGEQSGELELSRSSMDYTEFTLRFDIVN